MGIVSRTLRTFATALGFAMAGFAAVAAAPTAGTVIENQATVTYFHTGLGILETVRSNRVSATVLPVPALDVSGGDTLRLTKGLEGSYAFRATNTGNTILSVNATMIERTDDDFDVTGILYVDDDRDGIVGPGEKPVDSAMPLDLLPGDSVALLYMFTVPDTVVQDDRSVSTLNVTGTPPGTATGAPPGTATGALTGQRDGITLIDALSLRLLKIASYDADTREIAYTLRLRNNGVIDLQPYDSIAGEPVVIDGAQRSVVLVRDPVPLNTRFASFDGVADFVPLYHASGDPIHTYTTTTPVDPERIDAIAFAREGVYPIGSATDLSFRVRVNDNAGDALILNTAITYVDDGTEVVSSSSNEVDTPVSTDEGILTFFDSAFASPIDTTRFDREVAVELLAGICNASPEIDLVEITVNTALSKDSETLIARETGPNTGVFRTGALAVQQSLTAIPGNALLEPVENDAVSGTAVCNGAILQDQVVVEPGGYVFDSMTNDPITNAEVRLFEATSTGVPLATARTGPNGFYSFDTLPAGSYRIEVVPPSSHVFPSAFVTFDGFDRTVREDASYGSPFTFSGGPLGGIDIPLDPADRLPLVLEKTASRDTVRRGEYVVYTITATNNSGQGLADASIDDRLPPGMVYVPGSAALDGIRMDPDRIVRNGRDLIFELDRLAPETTVELDYTLRGSPTSGQGRRVNTAVLTGIQARTSRRLTSQSARAIVRIDDRGGVFADEAVLIGRVFLDTNGDGLQGDGEQGIPGVKLVTSNGLSAVTDEEGRYSLFGLRPNTQVLSVRRSTLPPGAQIALSEIDDAGKPGSRFIDVKRRELRGEDFPVVHSESVARAVEARRESFERLALDESLLRDDLPLTFDGGIERLSARSENALDTTTDIEQPSSDDPVRPIRTPENRRTGETEAERKERLGRLLPTLTPELGFVGLEDETVTEYASIDILVKSPAETDVTLLVNDEKVPGSKIGAKLIDRSGGIQLFEYIAVPLRPGANTIATSVIDPFGNERGGTTRTVYAPGKPVALRILAPEGATADSGTPIPILVRVVDAEGRRVRAPTTVTLEADRGRWDVRDIRTTEPGLQSFIDNGEAVFDFIPPNLVGKVRLTAESGFGDGETEIALTPDLGERTLVGIVEGAVNFGDKGRTLEGLMDRDDISVFEETTEGIRGQLYLKGRILGDALLTLRYDSDQDTDERLFRDIARDEYYPVYGDSSERGFDAQSSSKLFVKVERGQSYILYGDIAVEPESDAIRLGAFRRSLTGGKAHVEYGPVSVTLFGAETELGQRVLEIPSRGVSGPYDVDLDGLRDGSEIVEIVTRDRDQPSVILDVVAQRRFSDYSLDYFSGALIFNNPVPLSDEDLNPVSIRITYETEDTQGERYFVYGGEVRYEVTEDIAVGYRELRTTAERGQDERRTVRSLYADAVLGPYGEIEVEVSQSENDAGETGFGYRASYDYRSGWANVRAEVAHTDDDFDIPGSYIGAGRDEARIKADVQVGPRTKVSADALYTSEVEGDTERYGVEGLVTHTVSENLEVSAGARAVRTEDADGTEDVLSGIVGVRYRPSYVDDVSLFGEYEQDLTDLDNQRLTLGADYQFLPNVKLYALNEFSNTDSGHFGLGSGSDSNFTTKIGVEYQPLENVEGYVEYRDGNAGTGDGVANGLRARWDPYEDITLSTTMEHVEPVASGQERRSAITVGVDYESEAIGILARSDLQFDRNKDGYGLFSNLAFGYRVDTDFTLLLRNRFAYDEKGDPERFRDRLRFGVAYRPKHDNRLRLLGWYEYEIDHAERTEQAHRWSFGGTWTHSDRLRSNWRYAGEYNDFESDFVQDSNTLHMLQLGMEYEFAENRFALAGNAALFTDESFDNYTLGLGAEVKAQVTKNVQIGIGYNHVDLEEDRIRELYNAGFYLRGKIKLDDDLWDIFDEDNGMLLGIGR